MGRRLANKMKYQQQWSDSSEKKKKTTLINLYKMLAL